MKQLIVFLVLIFQSIALKAESSGSRFRLYCKANPDWIDLGFYYLDADNEKIHRIKKISESISKCEEDNFYRQKTFLWFPDAIAKLIFRMEKITVRKEEDPLTAKNSKLSAGKVAFSPLPSKALTSPLLFTSKESASSAKNIRHTLSFGVGALTGLGVYALYSSLSDETTPYSQTLPGNIQPLPKNYRLLSRGLPNFASRKLQNICFMNSVLSLMYHVSHFSAKFKKWLIKGNPRWKQNRERFADTMRLRSDVLNPFWKNLSANSPVGDSEIIQNLEAIVQEFSGKIHGIGSHQLDAQEFFQTLLDSLEFLESDLAPVHKVMKPQGSLLTEVEAIAHEPSQTISFIPEENTTVQKGVLYYLKKEQVDADYKLDPLDQFSKEEFYNRRIMTSPPEVLFVHVALFNSSWENGKIKTWKRKESVKINPIIYLPFEHRGKKFASYEYLGSVVHLGDTLHAGHYISHVKALDSAYEWHNDRIITPTPKLPSSRNGQVYLIAYKKTGAFNPEAK